ncbi:hypothetical protein DFH09DRAFT_1175527 [Mycena vulgaris]|nr:hypothetical protein DFH09DRAFT_1175527 [Mycena vulgaris]
MKWMKRAPHGRGAMSGLVAAYSASLPRGRERGMRSSCPRRARMEPGLVLALILPSLPSLTTTRMIGAILPPPTPGPAADTSMRRDAAPRRRARLRDCPRPSSANDGQGHDGANAPKMVGGVLTDPVFALRHNHDVARRLETLRPAGAYAAVHPPRPVQRASKCARGASAGISP